MDKKDLRLCKKKILKCLTEDVKHKDGFSLGIYNVEGYQIFGYTTLNMVMDKVVLGLYLALQDSEKEGIDTV